MQFTTRPPQSAATTGDCHLELVLMVVVVVSSSFTGAFIFVFHSVAAIFFGALMHVLLVHCWCRVFVFLADLQFYSRRHCLQCECTLSCYQCYFFSLFLFAVFFFFLFFYSTVHFDFSCCCWCCTRQAPNDAWHSACLYLCLSALNAAGTGVCAAAAGASVPSTTVHRGRDLLFRCIQQKSGWKSERVIESISRRRRRCRKSCTVEQKFVQLFKLVSDVFVFSSFSRFPHRCHIALYAIFVLKVNQCIVNHCIECVFYRFSATS